MEINVLFLIIVLGLVGYGVCKYRKSIFNLYKSSDDRELEAKFTIKIVSIILGVIFLYFVLAPKAPLNSSIKLVESYLSENYNKEIKVLDIENIFRKNDDEVKVIKFDLTNINEAKTKKLKLGIRKGSLLYNDYEYVFLIQPSHVETLDYK